jgi:hypothetical protein
VTFRAARSVGARRATVALLFVVAVIGAGVLIPSSAVANKPNPYPLDGVLRLQDVQLLGTHNSYHVRPTDRRVAPTEPANYAHPPLDVQLSRQGIRSLELDVFDQPGIPVFHSIMVDQYANCPDLRSCLRTVNRWSRKHPAHLPISIFVELKAPPYSSNPKVQTTIDRYAARHELRKWDGKGIARIDHQVRHVFGRTLLTPDAVRGRRHTLRDAIVRDGWPTLGKVRGKVMVVLNTSEDLLDVYRKGAPSLQKKAMFVVSSPDEPSAAVISRDEPVIDDFQTLAKEHFLVRTLADEEGVEARDGDFKRAETAFESGATVVATDYPVPDPTVNAKFRITIPGAVVARCNPVTAPHECNDAYLEHLKVKGSRSRG